MKQQASSECIDLENVRIAYMSAHRASVGQWERFFRQAQELAKIARERAAKAEEEGKTQPVADVLVA